MATSDDDPAAYAATALTPGAGLSTTVSADPAAEGLTRELATGTRVGRYELLRQIGAGGMGVVYEARDTELARKVAIKLVRPRGESIEQAQARLRREAQAMAKLSHACVVVVHDIGRHDDQVFVAMELLRGGTLRQWMSSPHPWREVLARFRGIGRGLAAAHSEGLVHRDFKPDNVLLGTGDEVRIADFGLARAIDGAAGERVIDDATGSLDSSRFCGTPAYMAPEQFLGDATDARTDQFAFCVALYEAIEGVRPYEVRTTAGIVELSAAVLEGQARAWKHLEAPRAVRDAIARGFARDPADRWPSMEALLGALEVGPPPRARWPVVAAGLGVAGIAAVIGVTVVGGDGQRASAPDASAPPARWNPVTFGRLVGTAPWLLAVSWDETMEIHRLGAEIWGVRDDKRFEVRFPEGLHVATAAFAPDGSALYVTGTTEAQHEIWRVGLDGTPPTRIDQSTLPRYPLVSPDGRRIVLSGMGNASDDGALRVIDPGSDTPRLLLDGAVSSCAWNPRGTRVACQVIAADEFRVVAVDVETGAQVTVATSPLDDQVPSPVEWPEERVLLVSELVRTRGMSSTIERWTLDEAGRRASAVILWETPPLTTLVWTQPVRDGIFLWAEERLNRTMTLELGPDGASRGEPRELATGSLSDDILRGWTDGGEIVLGATVGDDRVTIAATPGASARVVGRDVYPIAVLGEEIWVNGYASKELRRADVDAPGFDAPSGELTCAGGRQRPCLVGVREHIEPNVKDRMTLRWWSLGSEPPGAEATSVELAPFTGVALSFDAKTLAVAQTGRIDLVELATGKLRSIAEDPGAKYQWLTWRPDGTIVVTVVYGKPRQVRLVDASGRWNVLVEGSDWMHHPVVRPDGNAIAYQSRAKRTTIFRAAR